MSSIAIKHLGSCEEGKKNGVTRFPMNPMTFTAAVPAARFSGVRPSVGTAYVITSGLAEKLPPM